MDIVELPAIRAVRGYPSENAYRYRNTNREPFETREGGVDLTGWSIRARFVRRDKDIFVRDLVGDATGFLYLDLSPEELEQLRGQHCAVFIHLDAPRLEFSEVWRAAINVSEVS